MRELGRAHGRARARSTRSRTSASLLWDELDDFLADPHAFTDEIRARASPVPRAVGARAAVRVRRASRPRRRPGPRRDAGRASRLEPGDVLHGVPGCPGVATGTGARRPRLARPDRARARRRARRAHHRSVVDAAVRARGRGRGRRRRAAEPRHHREPRARHPVRRLGHRRHPGRSPTARWCGSTATPARSPCWSYRSLMLDGYRVVELAVWVAGPGAGGVLADWGADVIKVEPPGGDPMRTSSARSASRRPAYPPFELDNRGKRIGRARPREPTRAAPRWTSCSTTADVFLTNLRPDALERLGLDPDAAAARHPRLVYASVTGYGLEGPDATGPATTSARSGRRSSLAATIVPPGDDPPALRGRRSATTSPASPPSAGICARAARPRAHGRGPARGDLAAAHRHVLHRVGHRHPAAVREDLERRRPRSRAMAPLHQLLRRAATASGSGSSASNKTVTGRDSSPRSLVPTSARDPRLRVRHPAPRERRAAHRDARRDLRDTSLATSGPMRFDTHDVWWAPVQTIPR